MSNTQAMSEAALAQWAKWVEADEESLSLYRHLEDAREVAGFLWDEWLPQAEKDVLIREFGNEDIARSWCVFYAGVHDVGKASVFFQEKVPSLFERSLAYGLDRLEPSSFNELRLTPHGIVGAKSLRDWLVSKFAFSQRRVDAFVTPISGHHGKFPTEGDEECRGIIKRTEDPKWEAIRFEFIEEAFSASGLSEEALTATRNKKLSAPAQMLLSGIVVMADWIASNSRLFPLSSNSPTRIDDALDELDFPEPWTPTVESSSLELFQSRFELPSGASPYPVQLDAIEIMGDSEKPGLLLIEAPTGEGKTEAALGAAEKLASKFGSGGLQVALPTCATSDAMFSRVIQWLERAVPEDGYASTMLTHSRAQFNDDFRGLMFSAMDNVSEIYDETSKNPSIEVHWWLNSRKTGALAQFTVGTIDQFLFSALQAKHVMLRHVGLAGKVLVLDEIHAADAYMREYLYRALEWCGAYSVPVVALSATLPPNTRADLMRAYASGQARIAGLRRIPESVEKKIELAKAETAYPLLTFANSEEVILRKSAPSARSSTTKIEYCEDDEILATLQRELVDGGCAVIVCNTVRRAQEIYDDILSSGTSDESDIFLLHSRFTAADRRRKEADLVAKYGKNGHRPSRGIVVATQVVEQSLDLDFDVMFSELAPTDLIIQRIGRLHRHSRKDRPTKLKVPKILFFGSTEPTAVEPPRFSRGSERVYGKSLLLRTAAVLLGRDSVSSPSEVAELVRATYSDTAEAPTEWAEAWISAEEQRSKHEREQKQRADTYLGPPPWQRDMAKWSFVRSSEEFRGQSQVRDMEESIEVVLVTVKDDGMYSVPWMAKRADERIDNLAGIDAELAREVAKCTVSIPFWQVGDIDAFIAELERYGCESWQKNSWLKGLLPMPLNQQGKHRYQDISFSYDTEYGLRAVRDEEPQ